ncbi:MAG: serine/threonine protein kinase [Bdellovibrionota bacterium]
MMNKEGFYKLAPEQICTATESFGFQPTGQLIQLNSFENRVYHIYLEDRAPIIAKFYRPNRWSYEAISEEHWFLSQLEAEGLMVGSAIKNPKNQDSIGLQDGIYFSFFEKHQGRMPDEIMPKDIRKIARTLARLHNVGQRDEFQHRPFLDGEDYGWSDLDVLENWIEPSVHRQYITTATKIINRYIDLSDETPFQRIHGDCHRGNLLDNGQDFFFVDFDDCITGPVAQDIWMLTAGDEGELLEEFLKAYEELRSFDREQLKLIPLLQALRIIHYSAWIAKRWEDPHFPQLFPQFKDYYYWAEELENLNALLAKA